MATPAAPAPSAKPAKPSPPTEADLARLRILRDRCAVLAYEDDKFRDDAYQKFIDSITRDGTALEIRRLEAATAAERLKRAGDHFTGWWPADVGYAPPVAPAGQLERVIAKLVIQLMQLQYDLAGADRLSKYRRETQKQYQDACAALNKPYILARATYPELGNSVPSIELDIGDGLNARQFATSWINSVRVSHAEYQLGGRRAPVQDTECVGRVLDQLAAVRPIIAPVSIDIAPASIDVTPVMAGIAPGTHTGKEAERTALNARVAGQPSPPPYAP